ncbi:54S ribosomal protein L24, mitochondrial-like [Lotus japonicus]|uniref:Large ribosomal subunit protein bL28m n=1 Tax=Lotus japonicus TaxID=34305 RepID=I3SEF4_LOTJA|nr:54S ribosomal protein L24, mitochondrial-like [Lotus japonicus]AFK38646.1 unknown [Lotus japonicus]
MAFRGKEMMKKVLKKVGEKNLTPKAKESLQKCIPKTKIVMGRAKRGLFAGRHIQFGNTVSEDGGNKTRRNWKPNVQDKRLFSYILDRHIRAKVTTHALRCIDKAGGIDEYLLKTPYHKMDTEIGVLWKAKIEKLYEELGKKEVVFFSPEDEANFEQSFKDLKLSEREARKEIRKIMYAGMGKHKLIGVERKGDQSIEEGGTKNEEETSHDSTKRVVPVSYVLAPDKLKIGSYVSN